MNLASDIAFYRTYSAVKSDGTKETWAEVCDRYQNHLIKAYPNEIDSIVDCVEYLRDKKIAVSMRLLQFAGIAAEKEQLRGYNCSFVAITTPKDFSDILYLSSCGVGCGFSVQKHHVAQLSVITKGLRCDFQVEDSRESWADSIECLFNNPSVKFDYSAIRPAGAPLSTGGQASGPEPLRECHERIRGILLGALGRKLRPIEVHSICCSIGHAIVAGGVRRSAMISLFDHDDVEMLTAKAGNWWEINPHFARANNSAVFLRSETRKSDFDLVFDACIASEAGEPGVFFTNSKEIGTNPCVSGDTKILTKKGNQRIDNLVGTPVEIWNGFEWSTVTPKITGENQEMLKIKFSDGRVLRTTRYHKFHLSRGYQGQEEVVKAEDLKIGDKLIKCSFPVIETGKSYENMYMQGFKSAEGMDDYNFIYVYEPKFACLTRLGHKGEAVADKYGRLRLKTEQLLPKSFLPFNGNLTSKLEWLAGLFDGDGCELKEGGLQLVSVDAEFLSNLQTLLTTVGVQSKIVHGQDAGMRLMPDGRGGEREFMCQAANRICIGSTQMQFLKSLGMKCERLQFNKEPNRDATQFVKVVSIEENGTDELVYCFDEPKRHFGVFNGVITGQCAEISLRSRQLCNLTEVILSNCVDFEDFRKATFAATILGTYQAGLTNFNYVHSDWAKNCREDALLGVSITGQANKWELLQSGIDDVARFMKYVNDRVAARIGINRAARIGAIKPSGTTSTLMNCSSGIHADHAKFFIRRIRIGKLDPLAQYLVANLPSEFVEYSEWEQNDVIIAIPTARTGLTRHDETALHLLERMKYIKEKWIHLSHHKGVNEHNVSLTVNYKPEEIEGIREWMWENRESYNGISLLPFSDSTYSHAPYEDITEERYNEMSANLPAIDFTKVVYSQKDDGRTETAACEGGLCSLKGPGK